MMKKADRYPIRRTICLDAEMEDALKSLAIRLQRGKRGLTKGVPTERITINTVNRVAIRLFLKFFGRADWHGVEDEEQLTEFVFRHMWATRRLLRLAQDFGLLDYVIRSPISETRYYAD